MNLVDRETSPLGVALVNPNKSGKRGAYDLVELAAGIENADQFTKANAGSKLTVIAEQARTSTIYSLARSQGLRSKSKVLRPRLVSGCMDEA